MTNSITYDLTPQFKTVKSFNVILGKSPVSEYEQSLLTGIEETNTYIKVFEKNTASMIINPEELPEFKKYLDELTGLKIELGVMTNKNYSFTLKSEKKLVGNLNTLLDQVTFMEGFYKFWIETIDAIQNSNATYCTLKEL